MNFPSFGHIRRNEFALAEGVAHLNHGSYGAAPLTGARRAAWRGTCARRTRSAPG